MGRDILGVGGRRADFNAGFEAGFGFGLGVDGAERGIQLGFWVDWGEEGKVDVCWGWIENDGEGELGGDAYEDF